MSCGRLFCSSCVECKFFFSGPFEKNCSQACPNIQVAEKSTEVSKQCREKDSQNCWISFRMVQEDGNETYTIIVDPKKGTPAPLLVPLRPQPHRLPGGCSQTLSVCSAECPEPPNIALIVGGTVAGVALIGLVLLLIWRLLTELFDRREYRRFEKEKSKAKWNDVREPICGGGVCWDAHGHVVGTGGGDTLSRGSRGRPEHSPPDGFAAQQGFAGRLKQPVGSFCQRCLHC